MRQHAIDHVGAIVMMVVVVVTFVMFLLLLTIQIQSNLCVLRDAVGLGLVHAHAELGHYH